MNTQQRSTMRLSRDERLSGKGLASRTAFTLTELLVVMMIISILASTVMFAMYGAVEDAKATRTRTQIAKLNDLVMTRWESYRTRAVRMNLTPAQRRNARFVAEQRLNALRELMRLELPDRVTDVMNVGSTPPQPIVPVSLVSLPSLSRHYFRRASATQWHQTGFQSYQGAECLYMIVAAINELEMNGLDFLHENEIGDVDGDGMPEILDAWGNPIEFLRWAPGYADRSDIMSTDPSTSPDPFDPVKLYPNNFALYPLIFSAGRDGKYDMNIGGNVDYGATTPPNDPYVVATPLLVGTPTDADNDGDLSYGDNITNHQGEVSP